MGYTPNHLGHVNIWVRNVEASHKWYEEVLGLHTYDFVPGRAAFMSADLEESHELAIMEVGADAEGPHKGQVGLNHMAWRMDTLDDLKDFYNNLKAKNVEIQKVTNHGLSLGIYFEDPDGNGIECYYETPRTEWFRQEKLFLHADRPNVHFPGPWEKDLAQV
ncbi:MAG: glyoxalase [Dehalococcoidia bacterium]|nr:glyoxalase [Dehalococcoidia bacterium]